MRRGKRVLMTAGLSLVLLAVSITDGYSARDGGYDVTADLWAKAMLKPVSGDVTLVWQMVGAAITPSGDQVISGYFYADPANFAYGSQYNPEVFVKIYIAAGGVVQHCVQPCDGGQRGGVQRASVQRCRRQFRDDNDHQPPGAARVHRCEH